MPSGKRMSRRRRRSLLVSAGVSKTDIGTRRPSARYRGPVTHTEGPLADRGHLADVGGSPADARCSVANAGGPLSATESLLVDIEGPLADTVGR